MNFKVSAYSAIISAIVFFIASLLSLIGYGISIGSINSKTFQGLPFESLILTILKNFNMNMSILYSILLITSLLIYIGYIKISKKSKQKELGYFSYMMLILYLVLAGTYILLFSFPNLYAQFPLKTNIVEVIFGLGGILFGIILIRNRAYSKNLFTGLGVLYLAQGLILLSTLAIPIKIMDFTIAIRVLESIILFEAAKRRP